MNSRTPGSRSRGSGRERSRDSRSREERKEATRRAIIDAALTLQQDRNFSSLSLREVTREAGIVPTAFYRHFESMEALGLVLIDESFRSLRDTLRAARAGKLDPNRVIESSAEILIASVAERREHWRLIGRERNSGLSVMRYAIRTEIRLIT
ncbi:TetR family transcriptional regulator, partial [Mycobacterium sp. THU-M116]